MNGLTKILQHKYWWIVIIILFISITYLSAFLNYRIDLTAEKRFSLTDATKELLKGLDSTVTIKVFLAGDLPSDYKKLRIAAEDILDEFRDVSGNTVKVIFEKAEDELTDSAKIVLKDSINSKNYEYIKDSIHSELYDSLSRLGVVFEQTEIIATSKDKSTNLLIIPSALVYYRNMKPLAIDLRSSRTIYKNYNIINDNPQEFTDKEATLNAAEALLEFKFANAIDKLTRKYIPVVAYTIGNGETMPIADLRINDLGESLQNEYRLAIFDLSQGYPDAKQIDALIIVKPTKAFSEEDKLKLDQYVMHGGKVIWFIDKLYAELDSLMRSKSDFIAFDRNLNLDDILFRYGVRINSDLLQDLNCAKIPIVFGKNPDGSPRMQRIPWPYYPFLSSNNNNPVSKNLDRVLPVFPSSIDTVKAPGIEKTILLATDTNSRKISSPTLVTLNSVSDDADFLTFNKSYVPAAVLLEGKFTSLFANRLTREVQDSVAKASGEAFIAKGEKISKQIVVSDADIVTNSVSPAQGPLPMGELPLENYRFANREFFLNCVDYLVSNNRLFEARNKDFTLRLLDKKKVNDQRMKWQLINIAGPIFVIILFGVVYQWSRKKNYTA